MNNELYHHGIKGMHWGIRRYQNYDGSLTDAGRRRAFRTRKENAESYSKDPTVKKHVTWDKDGNVVKVSKKLRKALGTSPENIDDDELIYTTAKRIGSVGSKDSDIRRDIKRQREWNAKNTSQLSDKELVDQILRLQREKQLKDLTDQVVNPGKSHVKDLLRRYGDQALTAAVTTGISIGITNKLNKKFNPQKSTYERMKDDLDAKTRLADEGMPVNVKGYKRKDGKWVPKD